jgi:hypothetical protein
MSKKLPISFGVVLAVLAISFILIPGGTALSGKVESGHYYLGSHGHFQETSRSLFMLSAFLSAAIGLVLPAYATILTIWRESRKPTGNRWLWLGPIFISLFGLGLFFSSIRCLSWI